MTERDFAKEKFKELDPREQRNLIKLKEKLKSSEISPQVVGQILPEAIIIGEDDHHNISKSMIDITERAIDYSVSKDPDILSSYLFPIIGAAIRKAVKNAMEELMMNLKAVLEKTYSWKILDRILE
ncbi:MAG: hypothetical protein RBT69_06040 [Spirochaetia bacterium]|jgi:OOP family OmpA-OmpF porin|nr:hypothetical protein [Spirochaetia bacterium]